jgi:hypothetical protein
MAKFSVECSLVANLVVASGFSDGVAALVGEQLSTYLGRCEAQAVAARKDGRMVRVGKADKDANADVTFLPLKAAKRDVNYLPARLLVIADAAAKFAKEAGIERDGIAFDLPDSVQSLLKGMEAQGKERQAQADKAAADKVAQAEAIAARQELAAQLLAAHDAAEEKRKVKAAVAA